MTVKIEPTVHMNCIGSMNTMQAMDGKLKREEEETACVGLIPRPLPVFISQPFLNDSKTKSGSSLGRLPLCNNLINKSLRLAKGKINALQWYIPNVGNNIVQQLPSIVKFEVSFAI